MTREQGTLIEGLCWFIVGLIAMGMIIKFAYEYR